MGLLLACLFYGVGINLLFLTLTTLAPLLVLAVAGPGRFAEAAYANPWLIWTCVGTLVLLLVHHLFLSQIPEQSFSKSFILAAVPLWCLATAVGDDRRLVLMCLRVVVLALAAYAGLDFLISGVRAAAPLSDPNNFATLLYLAWIPWLHERLALDHRDTNDLGLTGGVSLIAGVAIFATQSRYGALVVLAVCAYWLFSAYLGKAQWRAVAVTVVALVGAFLINLLIADQSIVNEIARDQGDAGEASIRGLLNASTLTAIREYGGVLGIGVGGFAVLYPRLRDSGEQLTAGYFTHNDYLQLFLEGGVLLAAPLLTLLLAVAVGLLRRTFFVKGHVRSIGALLALGFALAHAALNFVLVVLPLAAAIGVCLTQALAAERTAVVAGAAGRAPVKTIWWCGLAALFVAWLFLAIDTVTHGVFGGQRVPGTGSLSVTPSRALSYAELAQSINPRRSLPVFGEARLRELQLGENPHQEALQRVNDTYLRTIELDPNNALSLVAYHRFLRKYGGTQVNHAALLDRVLDLDRTDMNTAAVALEYYQHMNDLPAIEDTVEGLLAWCQYLNQRQVLGLNRISEEIAALAERHDSARLRKALEDCHDERRKSNAQPYQPNRLLRYLQTTPE